MRIETIAVHGGYTPDPTTGAVFGESVSKRLGDATGIGATAAV